MTFPKAVTAQVGYELYLVQCGVEPTDWKPMSAIGPGVREIRVRDSSGAFRVVFLASRPEAI
jgi:phage-related protein